MSSGQFNRRSFLKLAAAAGFGAALTGRTTLIAENQKKTRIYKAITF
jgi:uncharacterized protein (DUF1501 family)